MAKGLTHQQRNARLQSAVDRLRAGEPFADVLADTGLSYGYLRNKCCEACIKLARKPGSGRRPGSGCKVSPGAWPMLDWDRTDTEIAAELKVSRELVRQKRRKLDKPDPITKRCSGLTTVVVRWLLANVGLVGRSTIAELVRLCPHPANDFVIRTAVIRLELDHADGTGSQAARLTLERLQPLIDKPDDGSGCWVWKHTQDELNGYGKLGGEYAHRAVWMMLRGPLEFGVYLATNKNACRHGKRCVNPDHRLQVSRGESSRLTRLGVDPRRVKLREDEAAEIRRLLVVQTAWPDIGRLIGRAYLTVVRAVHRMTDLPAGCDMALHRVLKLLPAKGLHACYSTGDLPVSFHAEVETPTGKRTVAYVLSGERFVPADSLQGFSGLRPGVPTTEVE